jgi:hypothetical protein
MRSDSPSGQGKRLFQSQSRHNTTHPAYCCASDGAARVSGTATPYHRAMRKISGYGLSVLSLLTLTACSPTVRGSSGVRLTAGGPVAVLGLCDGFGALHTLAVLQWKPGGGGGGGGLSLERVSAYPTSRVVTVDLSHPDDGWRIRAGQPLSSLDPTQVYEIRAWNEEGDNTVDNFSFQAAELPGAGAAAGILVKTNTDSGYVSRTMTEDSFRAYTDEQC